MPAAQVFEYLLQKGADASLKSFPGPGHSPQLKTPEQLPQPPLLLSNADGELGVLEVATCKGFGWEPGALRAELARLVDKYADVPKAQATVYYGPGMGGCQGECVCTAAAHAGTGCLLAFAA